MPLEFVQGDITDQTTEAIANAANSRLAGGGGVDGAIHRRGGPEIMKELRAKYTGCPTGSAVITSGGKLKAKYVIHAVGPVYSGKPHDCELLAGAYRSCLELCTQHGISSIAFPSISTGAYGFPVERAVKIALQEIRRFIAANTSVEKVILVCFDDDVHGAYLSELDE